MDYQKNTEHIGSSDIGILILSGFERGKEYSPASAIQYFL